MTGFQDDWKVNAKMGMKLKKDDMVVVLSGNDRGKRGRILEVDREGCRVIVEGVNFRKHHEKVRQTKAGQTGGIEEREAPIHASNVAVVDPKTNHPVRLGTKVVDGKRVRVTKGRRASGTVLE